MKITTTILITILSISCSPVKEDVFTLKGKLGIVILEENFQQGFDHNSITFKLYYKKGEERKLINRITQVVIYTDPKPEEHYSIIRANQHQTNHCVFVNPRHFSLKEYNDIKNTLIDNIATMDNLISIRKKSSGPIYESTRQPKISSIRYIDSEKLRYKYLNSNQLLEVSPSGEVGITIKNSSGTRWSSIGYVINNGELLVTNKNKDFLSKFKSENDKTIFNDFNVRVSENSDEYNSASKYWVNRRDELRKK